MSVSKDILIKMYTSLCRTRRAEEEIVRIYPSNKIKSPVHLSIGQEFVSVAVCEALLPQDVVFGTYRGHALYLAKGGDMKKMFAELFGKETGCAKGKGGSMHLIDREHGVMGTSAIVGTTLPIAVGFACGEKYKNTNTVVACFFGDGAVDEGVFHESMNFAALKNAPGLFVCENNNYAIHSPSLCRHKADNIWEWAKSYHIPSERIETGDIIKIYEFVRENVEKMRKRECGPVFLECFTCRWKEHVGPHDDLSSGCRDKDEIRQWQKRDQLKRLEELLDDQTVREINRSVEREIREAISFAEESNFPSSDTLLKDIFKES